MLALKGLVALFPSADADGVAYRGNKYFAVPDSPRLGVVDDYVDCLLGVVVGDYQLQLHFGQHIDHVGADSPEPSDFYTALCVPLPVTWAILRPTIPASARASLTMFSLSGRK